MFRGVVSSKETHASYQTRFDRRARMGFARTPSLLNGRSRMDETATFAGQLEHATSVSGVEASFALMKAGKDFAVLHSLLTDTF